MPEEMMTEGPPDCRATGGRPAKYNDRPAKRSTRVVPGNLLCYNQLSSAPAPATAVFHTQT